MGRLLPALLAATNLVSAAPALAQDIIAPVIPGATGFDWSGFYLGVFAGGTAGEFDGESSGTACITCTTTATSTVSNGDGEIDYGEFSFDDESWLGGGNVGFNIQNGRLVFGAVGDVAATSLEGSHSFYLGEYGEVPIPEGLEGIGGDIAMTLEWLSTIRGIVGITSPDGRFLFFATGGLAIGGFESELGINFLFEEVPPAQVLAASVLDSSDYDAFDDDETTDIGLALGGGVGAFLTPNLSLDLTYLFVHFDEISADFDVAEIIIGAADAEFSAHLGRIGISYRFGGGLPQP